MVRAQRIGGCRRLLRHLPGPKVLVSSRAPDHAYMQLCEERSKDRPPATRDTICDCKYPCLMFRPKISLNI